MHAIYIPRLCENYRVSKLNRSRKPISVNMSKKSCTLRLFLPRTVAHWTQIRWLTTLCRVFGEFAMLSCLSLPSRVGKRRCRRVIHCNILCPRSSSVDPTAFFTIRKSQVFEHILRRSLAYGSFRTVVESYILCFGSRWHVVDFTVKRQLGAITLYSNSA